MLVHAASGGKAAAAVPAYLRQNRGMHPSSSSTSLVGSVGAGGSGHGSTQAQAEQGQHAWPSSLPRTSSFTQPSSLPRGASFTQPSSLPRASPTPLWCPPGCPPGVAEAVTVTVEASGTSSCAPGHVPPPSEQQQAQGQQRACSFGASTPGRRTSNQQHEHYGAPSRTSSEDLDAVLGPASLGGEGLSADAGWSRSRSSSSSSLAAAGFGLSPGLRASSRRASSASLAGSSGRGQDVLQAAAEEVAPQRPYSAGRALGGHAARPASKIIIKLKVRKE